MKRALACMMALLLLCCGFAQAEELNTEAPAVAAIERNYDILNVGTMTALSGNFFSAMFGTNASDMDVRALIHGYGLVEWLSEDGLFDIDRSVVSRVLAGDNEDGSRTYLIFLYEDLAYSDGTPITARDYAFSAIMCVSPEMAAIGANLSGADWIVGADEYKAGQTNVFSGVQIINDYELSITVKGEYLPFFYELALLSFTPYPIHVLAPGCAVQDDGNGVYIAGNFTSELLAQTILDEETGYLSHPSVVSGPYTLTSYDGEVVEFAINPNYKGNSQGVLPLIPTITLRHVTNEQAAEKLEAGELDLINKVTRADTVAGLLELTAENGFDMSNYTRSGLGMLSFCCEKDAVSSAKVRQALACCLDKEALIDEYVGVYGLSVEGYYGIGQWMFQMVNGTIQPPEKEDPEETEKEKEEWEKLSVDDLTSYELDLERAAEELEADGWKLNAAGKREKDGKTLSLTLRYPAGNTIGEMLEESFQANLAEVGVELNLVATDMQELLKMYYRQEARDCEIIFIASNFDLVFDPSATFSPDDAYQGVSNRTGIADETLYQLAVEMRSCEPGDLLSYCQKWMEFQIRFGEVLPAIPLYSNVYFDCYTENLIDYTVAENVSWAKAVIGANLSDIPEEEEIEDGEIEFID